MLATTLLDLANYSDDADAVVERLLASPKENAKSFKKRLSSIKRQRAFISRGESGAFSRDLVGLLEELESSGSEPKAGVEAVAAFYEADAAIFNRCDDSNGTVGDVFRFDAAELFVSFASRCEDKDWLLDRVIKLNRENGYGIRDVLFERMSQFLPEPFLRKSVERLWVLADSQTDDYASTKWIYAIESLAKQLKDPQLLEKAKRTRSSGEPSVANIIDIAKLHFDCGDPARARSWIERVPLDDSFMARERDCLLIAIYQAQNDQEKLSETAWRVFRKNRDVDSLEQLLKVVGEENRSRIVEEQAKEILEATRFSGADAGFLIETDRIDDAETYIIDSESRLNGDYYLSLLALADGMLKHNRFLAVSVLYRALLDSILARAKSKYYHHGVKYLKKLDALSQKISEWKSVEPHSDYVAGLRQKHKLKSSFWSRYSG